jgi:hypothetical protein
MIRISINVTGMQPLKIKKGWHEWNLSFEAVVAKR